MTDFAGPLLGPDAAGVCCYDPPLDGTTLCGAPADIHILVATDLGETPEFTTFSCLEHAEFARAGALGSHITDAHPVGTQCIGATDETTLWRYSTETVTGACIERSEHEVSEFVGKRRSTEASIVLTSIEVAVQGLDAQGDPIGEETELGKLSVNKEGYVELDSPTRDASLPGLKLIVRERGRDSRTTVTELRWPGAVVDPEEPTDPEEPAPVFPDPPRDLLAADITRTSVMLTWMPPAARPEAAEPARYELWLDGEPAGSTSASVLEFFMSMDDPGDELNQRLIQVRSVSALNVASAPATIQIGVPPRETEPDPDPEPGENPWPEIGTVGFMGDPSTLTPMRSGAIRTAGTVIEGKRIDCSDGELGIHAKNVTIRNCIIDCGIWGVYAYNDVAEGLVIEDCTFIGGYQAGIGLEQLRDWRVSRCDFYGGRDAIKPGGQGLIEDCTMHDPATGGDAHNDCLQFSHCDGVIVRRNNMQGADTSCIAMFENQGNYRGVIIQDNYLTGAGYLIYAGGSTGQGIQIIDNVLGDWGWGPVTDWDASRPGNEWSGNVTRDGVVVRP